MDIISSIYIIVIMVLLLAASGIIRLLGDRYTIIQKYLPVVNAVQLTLWVVLVFWIIRNLFSEKSYYAFVVSVLITVLIILVTWFFVKDIVAGFLFRIKHNPLNGQILTAEVVSGIIKKSGLSFLTIEKADGDIMRIPYSTVINQPLSIQSRHHQIPGHVTVMLKTPVSVSPALMEQRVRQTLAMSSWCVASKSIDIEPVKENPEMTNVTFYLVDPFYRTTAEKTLNQVIKDLSATTLKSQ